MNINTCNSTDLGTTTTPSHTERCSITLHCGAMWPGLPLSIEITCDGTLLVHKNVTKTLYSCKIFVPGPCAGNWKTVVTVREHVWFSYDVRGCIAMNPATCECPPGYSNYFPPQSNQ